MNCEPSISVHDRQLGFTLIEVLVALAITGMLASLLMSAVFFAGRTRIAVEQDIGTQLQQLTNYSRFEQTLKYCLPELQKEAVVFRGAPFLVECFSTQNLQGEAQLMPLNIRWMIQNSANGQSVLMYADQMNWDKPIQISALPSKVRFVFWDARGKKSNDWKFEGEQIRLIPRRITIEIDDQPELNGLWSATLLATPHADIPPLTIFGTVVQ